MINRMRKGIIKIVVLILVFCLTVVAMGGRDRQSEMNLTSEMASVTLPVVCLQRGDMRMNQLYGYRTEMDACYARYDYAAGGRFIASAVGETLSESGGEYFF